MNIKEIRDLEKKAANGWIPLESEKYKGCELRFAEGYTGRANSVSVFEDSDATIEEIVDYCEKKYKEKGLPCNFKVTDADKDLSNYLLNKGYKVVTPTDVMILDLNDEGFLKQTTDVQKIMENVEFAAENKGWIESYFEFEGFTDEKKKAVYKKIHSNVKVPQIYVTVYYEGKVVAVASVANEDGYSLLHNVIVDSKYRGLGLGKKLCLATLLKAKEAGVKYSYLQVIQNNETAINLYKKLGYKKIYEYCYLKQNI